MLAKAFTKNSDIKKEPLAIIAGRGNLPQILIQDCQKRGQKFSLFLLESEKYEINYSAFRPVILPYTKVTMVVEKIKEQKIKNVVFVGAVNKPNFSLMKNVDKKAALLLAKIVANKMLGDDSVLKTVINFFEKEGLKVLQINELLTDLAAKEGVLTKIKPNKNQLLDIKIGVQAIKTFSKFDVGQSIAVAQKQIIGVEAVEGTDELIKRCAKLDLDYKKEAILIKLKKIGQSKKADLPTIGVDTIKNLHKSGFKGIAIQAGSTLILQKEKVIDLADELGLFVIALKI